VFRTELASTESLRLLLPVSILRIGDVRRSEYSISKRRDAGERGPEA